MNHSIDWYVYWKITGIKDIWDNQHKFLIFQGDAKKDIVATLYNRDAEVWDEIELIANEKGICIARHNITKGLKEKLDSITHFPVEVFQNNSLSEQERRKQQLHMLYTNARWLHALYKKYNYLKLHWWNIWGARDPNCEKTFITPKQFFDNARNICFFYNIIKGREEIRNAFDEGLLSEWVFDSIIKNFYTEFLLDIKKIPDTYQSDSDFSNYFADIKQEVGL